jgi:hypothetical protein
MNKQMEELMSIYNDNLASPYPVGTILSFPEAPVDVRYIKVGSIVSRAAYPELSAKYPSPKCDSITWTARATPPMYALDMAYAGGRWLIAYSNAIAYSTNGYTWTKTVSTVITTGSGWQTLCYHLGKWYVMSSDEYSSYGVAVSSDGGVTWTATTVYGSAYVDLKSNGTYMLLVDAYGYVYKSTDGITWNGTYPSTVPNLICWHINKWISINGAFSTDGITWVTGSYPTNQSTRSVVSNGSILVAIGSDGGYTVGMIACSLDNGGTWRQAVPPTSQILQKVIWDGVNFIAIGGNGEGGISQDGSNWSPISLGNQQTTMAIASNGGTMLSVVCIGTGFVCVTGAYNTSVMLLGAPQNKYMVCR